MTCGIPHVKPSVEEERGDVDGVLQGMDGGNGVRGGVLRETANFFQCGLSEEMHIVVTLVIVPASQDNIATSCKVIQVYL
jgi:hypothetical protein